MARRYGASEALGVQESPNEGMYLKKKHGAPNVQKKKSSLSSIPIRNNIVG